MKYTNKDAKVRFYDNTWADHASGTYSTTDITGSVITVSGQTWTTNQWQDLLLKFSNATLIAGPHAITGVTADTVTVSGQTWTVDSLIGHSLSILSGNKSGESYVITDNTADTITVTGVDLLAPLGDEVVIGDSIDVLGNNLGGAEFQVVSNTADTVTLDTDVEALGALDYEKIFFLGNYYFEVCLDSGDFSAPVAIKKHEEILVLDRGLVDDCAHYIIGNDMPIMEPLNVTFSVMINDSTRFLEFLNLLEGGAVNGHTTTTTKGTTIRRGKVFHFADSTKKCFNVEYKMGVTPGFTNAICYKFAEVYFEMSEQTFAEAEDGVTLSLTGMCYGTIVRESDFTEGVDIMA